MIRVNLDKYLAKEERNVAWVYSKTGIAKTTLYKLRDNETTSISFDVLEKLCDLFNCEIKDMLEQHVKDIK
ncbi:MAG: helix-turn-helix transcriptional regulator [Clostridium butyricum]|uniref:helix-turn-helix domain-containing protein n=1 Tax=Clostridium butyricum TaxID=1492 RepID=UPI0020629B04|nr:helix-turn-helix transcriptional regulator [Clostridium butyricum]DAR44385.1 MAG TPA: Cro/C1-type HTH DNA-binding domain protein [Caudoviricetes sp.]